ncbi:MAG: DsbA family protein, partial [Nitrospira sp.]
MKRDPMEHGGKRISGGRWLMAGMCVCVLSSSVFAEPPAPVSDPAFQHRIEEIVQQYIKDHPEVIEASLAALDARRTAEEKERVRKVIATRQADLLHDPSSPVSGNPTGDVTLVEFFDYRCGFCKRVAAAVAQLQKDDPRVRVVYKDFPILGEPSELAAKGALAAKAQGKHLVFHEALLATKTEITKDELMRLAGEVGVDVKRLE